MSKWTCSLELHGAICVTYSLPSQVPEYIFLWLILVIDWSSSTSVEFENYMHEQAADSNSYQEKIASMLHVLPTNQANRVNLEQRILLFNQNN